jgi:C1A family cysteine protease
MQLSKKITYFIFLAIMLAILTISPKFIFANNIYPLENGEKLIEQVTIDKYHVSMYTQLNGRYYVKNLARNLDAWVIEDSKIIQPKWTGLKAIKTEKQGDRQLARALKSYGLESTPLPEVVDYSDSEFLPLVGEQGEKSCVGWSTGYYLRTYQQAKDIGWDVKQSGAGINSHIFSPTFIYNQINNGADDGAAILDAAKLLKDVGDATLKDFPYILGDYYTKPTKSVVQSAYPNRVSDWRVLFTDNDADDYIIQKSKEYLNTEDLIVVGSKIGLKFLSPVEQNGKSIITIDNYPLYGHAYVLVGYDDTLATSDGIGAFKLINSWGTGWGDSGFSYISYKAFTANVIEGYVFTDLVNCSKRDINVDINNNVVFNMNLVGTGDFDILIKDENNKMIYEKDSLQAKEGLNTFFWDGKNDQGNAVQDGIYKLSIPEASFEYLFNKSSKVDSVSGCAYTYENSVQYVEIPIAFKADGTLCIKVVFNDISHDIVTNEAVKAGQHKVYRIREKDFDFNDKDLDKIRLEIDIQ